MMLETKKGSVVWIKVLAVLGMIWTICQGLLVLAIAWLYQPPEGPGFSWITPRAAGFWAFNLIVFWRLYRLRLWAAIAAAGYWWWMVSGSLISGIWQWTSVWLFIACLATALPFLNRKHLQATL